MIPYFSINVLCLLFFTILEIYKGIFSLTVLKSHILGILLGLGYATETMQPVCSPMWFFYAMFIVKAVYVIIPQSRISKLISIMICFVLVKLLTAYQLDTFLPIDSAIMAYPFFVIGTECRHFFSHNSTINKKVKLTGVLFAMLTLALTYFISTYNGRCDIDTMLYGKSYFLFLLTGCGISFTLMKICSCINIQKDFAKQVLKTFCSGAPLIVGLNILVINLLYRLVISHITDSWCDLYGLISGMIIMLLFYPLILLTKKYIPFVIGYRK